MAARDFERLAIRCSRSPELPAAAQKVRNMADRMRIPERFVELLIDGFCFSIMEQRRVDLVEVSLDLTKTCQGLCER